MKKIATEKEKFSERLKLALKKVYPSDLKSSDIAIRFNLRHQNEPVTPQAVYKWLNGLAFPSEDKIETLALWLKVKPEWLRYGIDENEKPKTALDEVLAQLIQTLTERQKAALVSFITSFENH